MQVIARDGFARCDCDCFTVADLEHAATYGHMMLGTLPVSPSRHGNRKDGQEIGMPWQDTESACLVLSAQMRDAADFGGDGKRRCHSQLHAAFLSAPASRSRASPRSPIM